MLLNHFLHHGSPIMHRVRVWDLPTRLFHWTLMASFVGLIVTGSVGGNLMEWHLRLGLLVMALLLFRLVWGFLGGRWSRFASFVYSPATCWRYLKGQETPEHNVGHNPLGALSVFAMLALLLAQVGSGLVSDDEIAFFGPLVGFVSSQTVASATWYHKEVGKLILLGLIAVHLIALVYYRFVKSESLTTAMLNGDKVLPHAATPSRDDGRHRMLALVVFAACCGVAYWVGGLGQV
jgi:cytochrome b